MNERKKEEFQAVVWDYYHEHGRHDLPWRQPLGGIFDPYRIMVSEIMLQQTQVNRVIPKYTEFLQQFPATHDLAQAPLSEVLRVWSGLGYNRRAKYLWQAAKQLSSEEFPETVNKLTELPGIGHNTAAAILCYAFNQPVVFIETNIRTVYLHLFFQGQEAISDKQILPIAADLLDQAHPRQWHWALMDYGTHLKQTVGNLNRLSIHYSKQSAFQGSRRQLRGAVLRLLGSQPHTLQALQRELPDQRLPVILTELTTEGMIRYHESIYLL